MGPFDGVGHRARNVTNVWVVRLRSDLAVADHEDVEAASYADAGTEYTEPGDGLLDGLEFDLDGLDLGNLTDMAFDATYDLIGSDPAEQGWWQDLASDHNHDGAYETISADDPYAALLDASRRIPARFDQGHT